MSLKTITKSKAHNRLSLIATLTGSFALILGIICILIKAASVEYIDQQGFLHENFFLLPIGFSLIFAGGAILLGVAILALIRFLQNRK